MTIKDCILAALHYLDLKDYEDGIVNEYADFTPWMQMAKDVIAEICTDFYPIKATEKLNSDNDGIIPMAAFSLPVIDVLNVFKKGTKTSLPFMVKYDCIDIGAKGEFEVEYSFMPKIDSINAVLPFNSKLSARIIGYGIAAEYCIIHNPCDTDIFDKRYKDALKQLIRPKIEKKVKKRSWL